MPYMEGPRKAKMKETNNYYQGKSGSKFPILPQVVSGVRHNSQASGGINRAVRGVGAGKMSQKPGR